MLFLDLEHDEHRPLLRRFRRYDIIVIIIVGEIEHQRNGIVALIGVQAASRGGDASDRSRSS